jgi:membrane-associated phospholipid phosphatase
MRKKIANSFFSLFISSISFSQSNLIDDTLSYSNQSEIYKPIVGSSFKISEKDIIKKKSINGKSFLLPGGLILTGALLFDSQFNKDFQKKVTPNDLTKKIHLDDYFQFAPAAITFGLEVAGVKGKHNALQTSIIYVMSNVFLNVLVVPTKRYTQELRPDSSNNLSFPSGHTSEAFASAELMRMEYQETQPWLGVAGYAMAVTTGYLRMYNNKHWISDVIAGAGIGIASTRLSYLIYDKVSSHIQNKKKAKSHTLLLPSYQNHQLGFNLVKRF